MKKNGKHAQRVEKIKGFASNNKVFTFFVVVLFIFVITNLLNEGRILPSRETDNGEQIANINENDEEDNKAAESENKKEAWRFYFIDVLILISVGGFLTFMIIKERRKANDDI